MAEKKQEKAKNPESKISYSLVRIMQTDIPGNKKVLTGLTYLKGVSWSISNALCKILEIDPNKKVEQLEKSEIEKITGAIDNLEKKIPRFLLNRRKDFETGLDSHLTGAELDMKKEFDIRRLKKIRSYRGLRHATGQPTRGQRTKSHFRTRKKNRAIGVKTKKK
jgi:small subunit ribosomal protein S13